MPRTRSFHENTIWAASWRATGSAAPRHNQPEPKTMRQLTNGACKNKTTLAKMFKIKFGPVNTKFGTVKYAQKLKFSQKYHFEQCSARHRQQQHSHSTHSQAFHRTVFVQSYFYTKNQHNHIIIHPQSSPHIKDTKST